MTEQSHITITRLGHKGDGMDDAGIFAPRTLPGEEVAGVIENGRIDAPKIVTPSSDRVKAACKHYGICGGCALMHASDDFVANWKRDRVVEALEARGFPVASGLYPGVEVRETITSPAHSRRRATLSGRRTKKGCMIGFHGRAADRLAEITQCEVIEPAILEAKPLLEALVMLGGSRKGEVKLAVTTTLNGLDIEVRNVKELDGQLRADLAMQANLHNLARLTWDGEPIAVARPAAQKFGIAEVTPPAGAFLQATRHGHETLVACVKEAIGPKAKRIADLFAGSGTFTLPMAEQCEVLAVEGEKSLTEALEAGWRATGGKLKRVVALTRDLFRRPILPNEMRKLDAVVIDPPRAGAKAQCEELARSQITRIAMVSCDPASFARDARILVDGGYHLEWVQPVDQFRWSTHVELAASFSRRLDVEGSSQTSHLASPLG